jgi:nickel-dependent lactate racemase
MEELTEGSMKLSYGLGCVECPPGDFELVLPQEMPAAGSGEIERALANPLGKSLDDLGGRSAALLVSDITRPAPSHLMLPPLIDGLKRVGVSEFKVVFALGTHRRMTVEEERRLLQGCYSLPHLQHDPGRCTFLGETRRGTPVEVLEEVASSDLVVATGNIEYHYYAGYSGGAKSLLPGVSSERSIVKNHELMRDPRAVSGRLDSPVREDMEDAASVAGLDFILNVVCNSKKEIVKAAAGDFLTAHREGAAVVDEMYRAAVEPAEIVITCAGGRPKDINLFQAQKALDNAKEAAVAGGTIILLAECSEGPGNPVFERWAKEAECAEDCVERFGREYEFGGHKAALIARESLRHHLIIVSAMAPELSRMCFFEPAKTLEEAVAMARERHGEEAGMLVMPHGNLTLAVAK